MSKIIEVTDLSLPGPKVYTRLTEAQLRSRLEPEKGFLLPRAPRLSVPHWTPGLSRFRC